MGYHVLVLCPPKHTPSPARSGGQPLAPVQGDKSFQPGGASGGLQPSALGGKTHIKGSAVSPHPALLSAPHAQVRCSPLCQPRSEEPPHPPPRLPTPEGPGSGSPSTPPLPSLSAGAAAPAEPLTHPCRPRSRSPPRCWGRYGGARSCAGVGSLRGAVRCGARSCAGVGAMRGSVRGRRGVARMGARSCAGRCAAAAALGGGGAPRSI